MSAEYSLNIQCHDLFDNVSGDVLDTINRKLYRTKKNMICISLAAGLKQTNAPEQCVVPWKTRLERILSKTVKKARW